MLAPVLALQATSTSDVDNATTVPITPFDRAISCSGVESDFQCKLCQSGNAVDAELAHQAFPVGFDCASADAEFRGDRLVGESTSDAGEDIALTRCQLVELPGRRRRCDCFSTGFDIVRSRRSRC